MRAEVIFVGFGRVELVVRFLVGCVSVDKVSEVISCQRQASSRFWARDYPSTRGWAGLTDL